ncbi:MAG: 50S ribosomal protein L11 methyltransferase [Defluviitaleaceae bacterium]|nr:50S ribosomal protein L11 methyltransferase [Defluviitaleaceae bacterium]
MEWIEARIKTNECGVDPVISILMDCGIEGVEIIDPAEMRRFLESNPLNWDYVDEALMSAEAGDVTVKFFAPSNNHGKQLLGTIGDELRNLSLNAPDCAFGELSMSFSGGLDDDEWLSKWRKHYKPFRIGKSVVIKPTWEEYNASPTDVVFNIEPGHVFGTGLHQSTRLVVEALEKVAPQSRCMLDIGCGSGILSIIGMLLGAKQALAIDIDPTAAQIAYENARLNGIGRDRYRVFAGNILDNTSATGEDLSDVFNTKYDVITANIVADIIIALAPVVPRMLSAGGVFISSGIIDERVYDVSSALTEHGFTIDELKLEDGWAAITAIIHN